MCQLEKHLVLKSILVIYSVIALIVGVSILALLILKHFHFLSTILLSVLSLLAAILGFCIIRKEKVFLTKVYAVLIVILIIATLVPIFTAENPEKFKADVKIDIEKKWTDEKEHPGAMDNLQSSYKCCGKDSAEDYEYVLQRPIPKSCYDPKDNTMYPRGCLTAGEDSVKDSLPSYGLHWFGVIWDIIWFAFVCYFIVHLNKHQSTTDQTSTTNYTNNSTNETSTTNTPTTYYTNNPKIEQQRHPKYRLDH